MAKLAIIVPVYNVEEYLPRCIDSILVQSFIDFRLVLVNDGSTDRSGEICDRYKEKDNRVEAIHQKNIGLSMARNKGIEISTEEFITFIDSDDYIHRDMILMLYKNLVENKGDISVCQYQLSYESDKLEDRDTENQVSVLNNIEAVEKVVKDSDTNMIIACGKLYKRELFDQIRYPKGKYHEDEFVTYKLLYKARVVVITNAKLYYYTQRKRSITGDAYSLKRLEKLEGLKEAIDFFKNVDEKSLEIKSKLRYLLNLQISYYRVKYEIPDEIFTMKRLKEDYDVQYRDILKYGNEISIINKAMLKFFYVLPDFYCFMVKQYLKIGRKLK